MIKWLEKHKKSIYLYGGCYLAFLLVLSVAILTQNTLPYDPIFISISDDVQIAWYAIFILTGIVIASVLSYFELKKLNMSTDLLFDGLLIAVPLAIVGARLYYVLFDPDGHYTSFWQIINIAGGGLSIHGAVIVTIITVVIFTKIKKINFWVIADLLAVGFLIGQIIGRWGNFMNGELYGPAMQEGFLTSIIPRFILDQMLINGVLHHPTFLYESAWNFVGLIFLLFARRRRWFKVGDMIGLYLIWYGLGRGAIIEPLRTQGQPGDALELFGFHINIYMSLGLFMIGGILLIIIKHFVIPNQPFYVDLLKHEIEEQNEVKTHRVIKKTEKKKDI